jgi:hypothetical protein
MNFWQEILVFFVFMSLMFVLGLTQSFLSKVQSFFIGSATYFTNFEVFPEKIELNPKRTSDSQIQKIRESPAKNSSIEGAAYVKVHFFFESPGHRSFVDTRSM